MQLSAGRLATWTAERGTLVAVLALAGILRCYVGFLAGFEHVQTASYLALELPWGWQLWGLDCDIGLDPRQELYFRSLPRSTRLVVCTGSPALALGTVWCEAPHRDALERLDLPAYFDDGAPPPPAGACRLDLAGDIHHYARY